MLPLNLKKEATADLTILCVGAHADDIEIGCGGTLLHLKTAFHEIEISLGGFQRFRTSWPGSGKGR